MLGVCRLVLDWWEWYIAPKGKKTPSVTFLLIIKNQEEDIEPILRCLLPEVDALAISCEIIVVDWGSTDLTPLILSRLVEECPALTALYAAEYMRPAAEALPLCRGEVVHVFDLVGRLNANEFLGIAVRLLKHYR
jgi:hypothetical protein